jgi:glucosamine-6-phosphate deaminase
VIARTFSIDALTVREFPDRATMASHAAAHVAEIIARKSAAQNEVRVIFACAPSQSEFLAALVSHPIGWSNVTIFHMDEYVGLSGDDPQSFRAYLRAHLLRRISAPRAVHFLAGEADLGEECARYAALLAAKPIDLVCLGIGENGHLAFNDPPVADFADPEVIKAVALDSACRQQQVNDGCFPSLDAVPTHALTLTIPTLFAAHHLSVVVPGDRKAQAVHDSLFGPVATHCPASILRRHPEAVLHIDAAAGRFLTR